MTLLKRLSKLLMSGNPHSLAERRGVMSEVAGIDSERQHLRAALEQIASTPISKSMHNTGEAFEMQKIARRILQEDVNRMGIHECTGAETQNREIVKSNDGWMMIHEHDERENVDVSTDGIKYCPFCGAKLGGREKNDYT
ncbi:hypothetical protein [Paenibacillus campi]|uniref:hypothetical protein n=1 Tax=Paenibacillus campi TaxID=3106031 RepID=UPI002AFF61F8|nr:hypothetical protein [Paenibacillus sp. SGZ-1014]